MLVQFHGQDSFWQNPLTEQTSLCWKTHLTFSSRCDSHRFLSLWIFSFSTLGTKNLHSNRIFTSRNIRQIFKYPWWREVKSRKHSFCFLRLLLKLQWNKDAWHLWSWLWPSVLFFFNGWGTRNNKVTWCFIHVCEVCKFINVFEVVEEFFSNFCNIFWNFLINACDLAMNWLIYGEHSCKPGFWEFKLMFVSG